MAETAPLADPAPAASPWMTKAEVAAHMRVTGRTVDRWASSGRLTKHHLAGIRSVRFARAEVDRLVPDPTD